MRALQTWCLLVGVALLVHGAASWLLDGARADTPLDGHIYDTAFGSVYCAREHLGTCGVTLSECHDGHEYACQLNIRKREAARPQ